MKAADLFQILEREIPLDIAVSGDTNGYIGEPDPMSLDVCKVLLMMDYYPPEIIGSETYSGYDLLILHHPPLSKPVIPAYVIHSNWDIIKGGACDALADSLHVVTSDILDDKTGIGRIGQLKERSVTLGRFIREVMVTLRVKDVRIVNCNKFQPVGTVCVVSGFGLNPEYIQMAVSKGVSVFVSGDMTHAGAILAKKSGITLIDATHYATEYPGLCRLGSLIASFGPDVQLKDVSLPWITGVSLG